jgi:hypothetical protein
MMNFWKFLINSLSMGYNFPILHGVMDEHLLENY